MKNALVNVDMSSAGRSSSGCVYADIHINVDGHFFPTKDWSDFAVVISSWWCESALRLLSGKSEYEKLRFMEGPLLAEVSSVSESSWRIRCLENQADGPVPQFQEDIDAAVFAESLLASAEALLNLCRERNWWDKDADLLQSNAALLRQRFKT